MENYRMDKKKPVVKKTPIVTEKNKPFYTFRVEHGALSD